MRFGLMASLGILLPAAAAAQDVDTRPLDVKHEGSTISCGFAAIPGLRMQEVAGKPFVATWSATAEASTSDQTRLNLLFMSRTEEAVEPIATVASLWIELPEGNPPLAAARIRFDGAEAKAQMEVSVSQAPRWFVVNPANDSFVAYFDQLLAARTLDAELLDAAGKTIARHRWDVSRTWMIPDLLRKTGWRCTGAGS